MKHFGSSSLPLLAQADHRVTPGGFRRDAMVRGRIMSSISKPHLDKESAWRLGQEIRRRRKALGLSQAALGRPFTRAFVSAVEGGQCVPSLSALLLLAERLQTTGGDLIDAVNPRLAPVYTAPRATGQDAGPQSVG